MKKAILPLLALLLSAAVDTTRAVVVLSSNDDTKGSVMMSRRIQDTDLSVGSIIQAGDILSLTKYDLNMNEYRWRTDKILFSESKAVISKSNKEVIFGLDAVWTNPNHEKFYPVTEEKTDGNAWQMTRVNETSQRIYISGIQADQMLLPAGVTRYAYGGYHVEYGTRITVVAVAQEGCHITGWSNFGNPITTGVSYYNYAYDSPQLCPSISVLDITVDHDMDLRVNFAKNTFNVTLATSDDTKGLVMTSRRLQDTDLQMDDLIQTGDILTLTKFDLCMKEGRWKMNDNIQNDPALLKKDKFETLVFGPNASWTNPYNLVLSPVDETGNDGNVWKVTNIIDISTTHRIYIVGIKYPYDIVKLPTGVTRNDDGSYNVVNGTRLYLNAMAKEGCHVTGWSNGDTPIKEGVSNSNFAYTSPDKCPAVSELEITVNGDMDIRANFAENTFDVNFTALNANTIEDGKAIVKVNGTPATLTDGTLKSVEPGSTISITPSKGYRVAAKSDGLDNLRAAFQKDATVTINYVYKDDNSSTFVSNGDNTFTFVSGTGHGGGDAIIEKKLVVKDGLLVFSQKNVMADDRETFYFTFDPNEDTFSYAIPEQFIAGYHVNFISIIVNGTDITSNLYGGKYKTGVTFKMPVEALNVTYELVRDLSVGTAINLYIDNELVTDDTRLIVKQDDTYGYVPTVPLTVSLTDEIEGVTLTPQQIIAAGITPVILLKVKYNWSPVASFNPLTNLPDDIEPGQTYSIRLKGTDGSAYYDQTPRTSAVTLFDGYKMDVPAGSYITYYMDEALCVDDADLQLYTVTAVNDESVSLTAIPSANAQMPFLVYNSSSQPKTALLVPTKDEINQAVAPQFKGTLTAQEMPASSATTDYYVLSQNAFVWVKGSGTIPANKCWLEVNKTTNAPAKLRITETTGATGIAGISGISGPSALYDLQGRKVLHPTLRGIYIQNGKKIVVK